MPTWIGLLDKSGSPVLKISIFGFSPDISREFNAIIDTGFTGFLSMPLVEALPLGLILSGTTSTILADGSSSFKLTALGTAVVDSEKRIGTILLNLGSGPCDVLIGMEFLASFAKTLFVHHQAVVLIDNAEVDEVVKKALLASSGAPETSKLLETNQTPQPIDKKPPEIE
jgi:predicted aspartyl protease